MGGAEVRWNSPFRQHFRKHPGKPDTDYCLCVNFDRYKFMCHKSGMSGSLSYLFCVLGDALSDDVYRLTPWQELKQRIDAFNEENVHIPKAELPDWYVPVISGSPVYNYLIDRGLTDDDINYYRIGQGSGEDYSGWLVIPSFNADGECEYWVSRRIYEGKGPKYRNPPVSRRYYVGFLHQAIKQSKTVILCEGVFSAIVAGRDAVVSFGKYVTNTQLTKLRQVGVEGVVVALDGDAWKEVVDTASRCYKMGFRTWALPMPFEYDPADMGRDKFREYMEKYSLYITETNLIHIKTANV